MKFERFVDRTIAVGWIAFKTIAVAIGVLLVVGITLYTETDML